MSICYISLFFYFGCSILKNHHTLHSFCSHVSMMSLPRCWEQHVG